MTKYAVSACFSYLSLFTKPLPAWLLSFFKSLAVHAPILQFLVDKHMRGEHMDDAGTSIAIERFPCSVRL